MDQPRANQEAYKMVYKRPYEKACQEVYEVDKEVHEEIMCVNRSIC